MRLGSDPTNDNNAGHPRQADVYRRSVSVDPGDQRCSAFIIFESHNLGCVAYTHDPLNAAVALTPDLVKTQTTTVDVGLTYPRGLRSPTGLRIASPTSWSALARRPCGVFRPAKLGGLGLSQVGYIERNVTAGRAVYRVIAHRGCDQPSRALLTNGTVHAVPTPRSVQGCQK